MSYILDALKKAERDRSRPRVPTLATIHVVPTRSRFPVWWWIIAAALILNAVVIGVVFYSRPTNGSGGSGVSASTAPEHAAPADAAPAPPLVASPSSPAASSEAPAPAVRATRSATPKAAPRPVDVAETPRGAASVDGAAHTGASPATRRATPELKLDVLVYSTEPGQRAAYINGQRYTEGQRVDGRFVVERIVEDGVVLRGDGPRGDSTRFTLKQQ